MKQPDRMAPYTKRASLAGALLACTLLLVGWADGLEDIREKGKFVDSVQAAFTQEKYLEMLDEPLVSKGLLYLEVPGSLRWEYTGPVRSVLLMENETIRQYVQADNGMVEQKSRGLEVMRVFLQDASMWMKGEFEGNPDLVAEMASGRRVLLKPARDNAMAQMIQYIELRLTDTPGVVESVAIYEEEDTYTVIRFHDTKINQDIADEIFQKLNPDALKQ
ncbi:MAG: outer membrane lipoprotein carrier protein LolA [Desulfosalsimonadaceae bacterium]